jgi:pimeloyl-ACP methyl ester carboxylesterase
MEYNAAPFAARLINKPTMFIIAADDDITMWDQEIAVFESIPTAEKQLVVLPATDHMTLYSDLTALDYAASAAASWFVAHLAESPTIANRIGRFA